jgi:hypothetical protein
MKIVVVSLFRFFWNFNFRFSIGIFSQMYSVELLAAQDQLRVARSQGTATSCRFREP